MEQQPIQVPDNKNYEYAYNQSYKLAVDNLSQVDDLVKLCVRTGSRLTTYGNRKAIMLNYLNRPYQITVPEVSISIPGSNEEIPIRDRILILHYLLTAKGTPLSGKTIAFKELPEGIVYFRTFSQRTIKHLLNNFAKEPSKLWQAAQTLGGRRADLGDMAVTIDAFPRLPVTFLIWQSDDEFPADGNVLYDSTVTDNLPTEDIIVLSETLVWKLVKA